MAYQRKKCIAINSVHIFLAHVVNRGQNWYPISGN